LSNETGHTARATQVQTSALVSLIKNHFAAVVISCLVSLLFVSLMAQGEPWLTVPAVLSRAKLFPWILLAITCYIAGMICKGYRLRSLVKADAVLSTASGSNIIAAGYAANNVLPARLGELIRAGMLASRTGLPYTQALAVTMVERLLDGIAIVAIFAVGGLFYPSAGWLLIAHASACIILLMGILLVLLFLQNRNLLLRLASLISSWLPLRWQAVTFSWTDDISRALRVLRHNREFIRLTLISLVSWMFEAAFFMFLLPCFDFSMNLVQAAIIMAFTNLGILVPSGPGHVGVYHVCVMIACGALLGHQSVQPQQVLDQYMAYAILVHLVFYATTTVWGICVFLLYGLRASTNAALASRAKPVTDINSLIESVSHLEGARQAEIAVPRFWQILCDSLIPQNAVMLTEEQSRLVGNQVSRFVYMTLQSLPVELLLMLGLGLTGFRTIVLFQTLNFFENLDRQKRHQLVEAWAFCRNSLTRKLFRPVRSLVLFAFFENEIVLHAMAQSAAADAADVAPGYVDAARAAAASIKDPAIITDDSGIQQGAMPGAKPELEV
jgi:glycosyltransferase 2 family protein